MTTAIATGLSAALPKGAAKTLQRGIGCTARQAWRIIQSGRAPAHLRGAVVALLNREIEARLGELAEAERALREIAHAEEVAAQVARRVAQGMDRSAAPGAGLGFGTALTAVARRGNG